MYMLQPDLQPALFWRWLYAGFRAMQPTHFKAYSWWKNSAWLWSGFKAGWPIFKMSAEASLITAVQYEAMLACRLYVTGMLCQASSYIYSLAAAEWCKYLCARVGCDTLTPALLLSISHVVEYIRTIKIPGGRTVIYTLRTFLAVVDWIRM